MANKMWGGRLKKKTDHLFEKFSSSIDTDIRLAEYDAVGSMVQAEVLAGEGILTRGEADKIIRELTAIVHEARSGSLKKDSAAEDVHTQIFNRLVSKAGDCALKLQSARSRNEQVVSDTKLYCVSAVDTINAKANGFIGSIEGVIKAKWAKGAVMPGYTHLQHAQPVELSVYLGSYIKMMERDIERLHAAKKGLKISFGSGALSGTEIGWQKYKKAADKIIKKSGLKGISSEIVDNTIDTVSNRDFVLDILSAVSIIGMHLSRIAEDLIIFSSAEFGFVELPDEYSTGSSLMPQKKNPDALELIRGNAGRLYANLVSVLVTLKGLPLAYNRDMQYDKEPLFSSVDIICDELDILSGLFKGIKINKANISKQLEDEALYATDLAFFLAKRGVPFKKAHDAVGALVAHALDSSRKIKDMSDGELKKFSPHLDRKAVSMIFDPSGSIKSKRSFKRR
ncbi:MAG: argininosuccinate lyase [Candidatus Omnitrophica bacterium CG1_02_49_10]|nr:MAG: argininosuccinate lyase [Candidatus Omnitrophica bacterium CG1_02_49_10]